jgi:hypothetical protein
MNADQTNSDGDELGNDCDFDDDSDGCGDILELGPSPLTGGGRDPLNVWDFYDVNGTQKVDGIDVNLVRSKFTGVGFTPPEDTLFDRSAGTAPWAPGPPDGKINAIDINRVRASFNHSCQAPP